MKIAFVGDIHGRVFHLLAVVANWQRVHECKLDMIVQVGDFGAFPDPDEAMLGSRFVREDRTELDFGKYVRANGPLAEAIVAMKEQFQTPIRFIRGNHEDFRWLASQGDPTEDETSIDPFRLVRHLRDGAIQRIGGVKIAFLGGIETTGQEPKSIDDQAYNRILSCSPGEIDVLVTHDAPYGIGTDFHGRTQGSRRISELIDRIRPKFLFAGHYHQRIGPLSFGPTVYFGLNILIPPRNDSRRTDPTEKAQPGSLAILDTESMTTDFVTDERVLDVEREFDLVKYVADRRFG